MSETGAFSSTREGFVLHLGPDERAMLGRLLGELKTLLTDPDPATGDALVRLFPVVHPDDAEQEAEYQRLMRDELVRSKLAGIAVVEGVIGTGERGRAELSVTFDEEQLLSFMQAINGVRLVLGTMLDVSEDDSVADDTGALAPEYHLYSFLSWLLDSAVAALSPGSVF